LRLEYFGDGVIQLQLPPIGMDHLPDVSRNFGVLVEGHYVHVRGEGHHVLYGHRSCNPDGQIPLIRVLTAKGWHSLLCCPGGAIVATADRCATFEMVEGELELVSFDPPLGTNFRFKRAKYWDGIVHVDQFSVYLIDGQQYLSAPTKFACLQVRLRDNGVDYCSS